jgi:sugar phosphate isomerase/epimerase
MRPVIALQLYTLRDLTKEDMVGTLRRVKEIGYEGVELAGYGDATPDALTETVQELGLKVVGAHVGMGALQQDLGGLVARPRAWATRTSCASIPGDKRNAEGYVAFAKELEEVGREVRGAGFTLCYHNHDFELRDRTTARPAGHSVRQLGSRPGAGRNRHFLDSKSA